MKILNIIKDTELIKSNMEKEIAEHNLTKFDHASFGIYIKEENNEKHVYCIFSDKFEIEFTVDKTYDVMSTMVDDLLLQVLTKNYPTELTEFDKTELTKCINITAGKLSEQGNDISIMNNTPLKFKILNRRTVTTEISPEIIRQRLMVINGMNKEIDRIINRISYLLNGKIESDEIEHDDDEYDEHDADKLIAGLNLTNMKYDEIYDDTTKIEMAKLIDGLIILNKMISSSLVYAINHPEIMKNEVETEPASKE